MTMEKNGTHRVPGESKRKEPGAAFNPAVAAAEFGKEVAARKGTPKKTNVRKQG